MPSFGQPHALARKIPNHEPSRRRRLPGAGMGWAWLFAISI